MNLAQRVDDALQLRRDLDRLRQAAPGGRPRPLQARFSVFGKPVVGLLGYGLSADTVRPGGRLTLTCYFEALSAVPEDWMLFVQGKGSGGEVNLDINRVPVGGLYALQDWKPGQVIVDVQEIEIPPSWGAGRLEVKIGLWHPEQGRARVEVPLSDSLSSFRLVAIATGLGPDASVVVQKTGVSLRRRRQFGVIQVPSAKRVQLGLNLAATPADPRIVATTGMCSHRVDLPSLDALDATIEAWIAEAYAQAD